MAIAMHYFVGIKTGYVMTSGPVCPVKKKGERFKYLGYTFDCGWPKKMNTGRLLHKGQPRKKKKKLSKLSKN